MTIPLIQIFETSIDGVYIPRVGVNNNSVLHPTVPYVPVTVDIGKPIVNIPGCVEVHPENKYPDGTKNKQLAKDDDTVTYCDADTPSFDAMDYTPEQLTITREVPPPPVEPPPDPPTSSGIEPPNIPEGETECPAPNQPRVGDLTQNGDEKVIGHELQGTTCVVLYEPTTTAEKFLPSTNQVSVTASIAVVATASAAATPLLLRLIKPAIKKLTTTVQKKLGSHRELSKSELMANRYRQSKGLPPLKPRKK
tara:strand:- start:302 stop:1054 length:753 start_codon:yes stop_codon:yes gene_type:complete